MNLTVQIYKSVEPVGHECGRPAPYLFLRHFLLFSDALPLVPLADPGDNPAMTPSGLSVGLVHSQQRILHGLMGIWQFIVHIVLM